MTVIFLVDNQYGHNVFMTLSHSIESYSLEIQGKLVVFNLVTDGKKWENQTQMFWIYEQNCLWKYEKFIRFHSVLPGVIWNDALVASKINVLLWNSDIMCIFMIRNQWFPDFLYLFWPKFPDRVSKNRP